MSASATNYHTFNLQIPVGLHIVTPMATSSSLLDQFSLLLATGLGTLQASSQRTDIELAVTTGALAGVQQYELHLALRELAFETAQAIAGDFVEKLTAKLKPSLPSPLPPPPPPPEVVPPASEPEPPAEPTPPPKPKPEPEPAPADPVTMPPTSYAAGQQVQNQGIADAIAALAPNCPAGFSWKKEEGGWRCGGGSHTLTDAEVEAEYRKNQAK